MMSARSGGFDYPLLIAMVVVAVATVVSFAFGPSGALAAAAVVGTAVALVVVVRAPLSRPNRTPVVAPEVVNDGGSTNFTAGLMPLVLLCILMRMGMVVLLNATTLWGSFAPDAVYYRLTGEALLEYWADPSATAGMVQWMGSTEHRPFYSVINAGVIALIGDPRWPMSVINTLVSIGVGWVFGRVTTEIYGVRAGRTAFLLSIFFPSAMVWTSLNIREVWSHLVIGLTVFAVIRIRQSFALPYFLLLVFCLFMMRSIRPYMVPILVSGIFLSYVVVRVRQLPYAIAGLVGMAIIVATLGERIGVSADLVSTESLEQVHQMRLNLAFGGSAYGQQADTRTVAGSLAYLPEGIVRFLFAPFPWTVRSTRQALTLVESIAWYYIVYLAFRGLLADIRSRFSKIAAVFFIASAMTGAYALVSGNEGTAYRHRAQVMFLVFIVASGEWARRQDRKLANMRAFGAAP